MKKKPHRGSSINDVKALGVGAQGLCDKSTKALAQKDGNGVKKLGDFICKCKALHSKL